MAINDVVIVVRADDKASKQFDKISGKAKGLGKVLGTALKAGAVGAAVAVAGLGVAGVKMAFDFEKGLAEVKTLLPDLSEKGFGQLKKDVIAVSKEFGIATTESLPALYQAISAGVPPDNILDFMQTAAKASIGGVTDLETAVDGITSVVNSYGAEVIDAGKASDIMFTAVRLGKTDFQQLSASLFNVIPTASALGISFEDVAAQLATITAAGTPTSVATTQIRAAMVEAQKSGTNLAKAIDHLTGFSFAELIAQGQTMPEVFETLRQSMPEQDFKDLFGSVEALNAVLGVTGPNFDSVTANMDDMTNSLGATDEAARVMSDTASFKLNKVLNILKITLTELGLKALPTITKGIELFSEGIEAAIPAIENFFKENKKTFDDILKVIEFVMPFVVRIVKFNIEGALIHFRRMRDSIRGVIDIIKGVLTLDFDLILQGMVTVAKAQLTFVVDQFRNILGAIPGLIKKLVVDAIGGMIDAILKVVGPLDSLAGKVGLGTGLAGKLREARDSLQEFSDGMVTKLVPAAKMSRENIERLAEAAVFARKDDILFGPMADSLEEVSEAAGVTTMALGGGGGGGGTSGAVEELADEIEEATEVSHSFAVSVFTLSDALALMKDNLFASAAAIVALNAGMMTLEETQKVVFGELFEKTLANLEKLPIIGQAGVDIMKALDDAIDEGGIGALQTLADMAAAMVVTLKEGLDPGIATHFTDQFMSAIEEAIETGGKDGVAALENILGEMKAVLEDETPKIVDLGWALMNALSAEFEKLELVDRIGVAGSRLMAHLATVIETGGVEGIEKMSEVVAGMIHELEGLEDFEGEALGSKLMAALTLAIEVGGSEAIEALKAVLAEIDQVLSGSTTGGGVTGGDSSKAGGPQNPLNMVARDMGFSADQMSILFKGAGNTVRFGTMGAVIAELNRRVLLMGDEMLKLFDASGGSSLLAILRGMGLNFAGGGMVPGPLGAPVLATVHGGERILTPGQQGGNTFNITINAIDGASVMEIAPDMAAAIQVHLNGSGQAGFTLG